MIEVFIRKELLIKDVTAKNLAEPYFKKARSNLITMELLSKAEKFKEVLAIPKDHSTDEWVVIVAYYAMYMAALSLLAKIGFRSKSHTATAAALEEFFVKKNLLGKSQFEDFKKAKEDMKLLRNAKDNREIAQYSVTKKTTKELAETAKSDAHRFVDSVETIFESA